MAHLFKPVTVKPVPKSATVRTVGGKRVACWTARGGRKVTAPLTGDGSRCRVESPTWWVEYTDHAGGREQVKGFRDRTATMAFATRIEEKARAVRDGHDAPDRTGPAGLADHLSEFRRHLEDRGSTKNHVRNVVRYVRGTIDGCKLTTPAAVDAQAVGRWLAGERERLGWSPQNLNRRVLHLRQFGRWLARTGRARWNPFDALVGTDARGGAARTRRRIEHDHLLVLLRETRASASNRRGRPQRLAGPDRAALYLVAAYTGFRRGALLSLTPESFAWDGDAPAAVTVAAGAAKNRKAHTVPLHPAAAADLAGWLRARPPGKKLWPVAKWFRTAQMLRADLAAARAAWVAEPRGKAERAARAASDVLLYKDHNGEVFDFHALRVQFVSGLALAGVPLTAAQKLASHSTPTLTANVYTRWGKELAGEVAKLPGLGTGPASVRVRLGSAAGSCDGSTHHRGGVGEGKKCRGAQGKQGGRA